MYTIEDMEYAMENLEGFIQRIGKKLIILLCLIPFLGYSNYFEDGISFSIDPSLSSYGMELMVSKGIGLACDKEIDGITYGIRYHPFGNVHTPYASVEYSHGEHKLLALKGVIKIPDAILSATFGLSANVEGAQDLGDFFKKGENNCYNKGIKLTDRIAIDYGIRFMF